MQFSGPAGNGVAARPPISPSNPDAVSTAAAPFRDAPELDAEFALRGGHGGAADQLDSWCASYDGNGVQNELFRDAHLSDPENASNLPDGVPSLPEVGGDFCGFKLITELGRGAFGRVYLSQQGDLADRPVALKVSAEIRDESQRLARLQHTNIVPIYSFHRVGALQAVCMPYFGSATLADVATELSRRDSLPASGKMVASAVYDRRSRTLRTAEHRSSLASNQAAPPISPTAESRAPVPEAPVTQELKRLEGFTYVESILWIGARLADGLAHAHERGILHRDLKPANILLTDDGQPMLLDFNLAEDREKQAGATAALIGGTLPYMAPEHLEAFGGTWRDVDARSDLYSLGVILYELLTGRTPFTRRAGPAEKILPDLIAERRKGAPEVRRFNKEVSPAAEAIVRKCLHPDPAQRYQTCRDLKEDLERQLAHQPLLHQPEPSLRERARKWIRRNGWVRSTAAVAAVLGVVIAGLVGLVLNNKWRAEKEEAIHQLADFRKEHQAAQVLFYARDTDKDEELEGQAAVRRALDMYGVTEDPEWRNRLMVRRLPIAERQELERDLGQLLLLLASSVIPETGRTPEQTAEALRLNQIAEDCFGVDQFPRALLTQRASLVEDTAERDRLRAQASETPLREAWDHYFLARNLLRAKKIAEATSEAREIVRLDPRSFAGWFLLGNCTLASGANAAKMEAAVHFTTCESLRPGFFGSYFNRGLARLAIETLDRKQRTEFDSQAESDFTKALELKPGLAEAYLQRAYARSRQGKFQDALADADRALAAGVAPARIYLMRSRFKQRLGNFDGANRDMAEGLRQTPTDCWGWIDRGKARLEQGEAAGALSDFENAARCNPVSREAIHDQAHVLGEVLKRPRDAIRMIDRELELYPNQPVVVISRGVYHAQLGEWDAARADARKAVTQSPNDGQVLYRAACVYALTSRSAKDGKSDRRQAIGYLARALRAGFGYDVVDVDPDLAPLFGDPDFAELRTIIDKSRKFKGFL
jgi:serine/threonine protein kinase/tetratricopeptide (TPR) repeat protein